MHKSVERFIPRSFAVKLLVILIVGISANTLMFFIWGAYSDHEKIYHFESVEFNVRGGDQSAPANTTTDPWVDHYGNGKYPSALRLEHTPLPENSSGELVLELVIARDQGRIIGIDVILEVQGEPVRKQKMTHKFLKTYNETLWSSRVEIPDGVNWSYTFSAEATTRSTDVYRFYDRCDTVVRGDVLYKDTSYRTETPPLVTYAMLPGYFLARLTNPNIGFSVYFMLCAVGCACLGFLFFRKWGSTRAFLIGLIISVYPSMLQGARSAQDEPLIAVFFLIPVLLVLHDRPKSSGLMTGSGIAVKMWSILLIPALLSSALTKEESWIDRIKKLGLYSLMIALPVAALFTPFFLLAGDDFTFFLKAYIGIGDNPVVNNGFWYILLHGFPFFSYVKFALMGIIIISGLFVLYRTTKQRVHPVRVLMITTTLFFMFYIRILSGYYVFLMIILLPAMTEDLVLLGELFLIPFLAMHAYWLPLPLIPFVCLLLLADVLRRSVMKDYSFDRDLGSDAEEEPFGPLFKLSRE